MGTEYGKDWRAEIETGADDFTPIGGEISFDWKRSSEEIDLSSKDDGIYGATGYGQQKISISVTGNVKLPDAGLEKAFDTSKSSPPHVKFRLVKGATVKYEGASAIGNFSTSHNKNGPVTYSFDVANTGAPTVDDLGA